jgi:hypothetical protein
MAENDTEAERDDGAGVEPEAEAPLRPKKKRKKKKARRGEVERRTLDADGRERPRFLLDFPPDPELQRLVAAFEAGDYATVRRDAQTLADASEDPAVRDAALELRRRIDPDPLIRYLLLLSVLLLGFLVLYVYTHRQ